MHEEKWIVPLGSILVIILMVVTFVYMETNKIPGVNELTTNNLSDLNTPASITQVAINKANVMNNNANNQNTMIQGAVNYPKSIVITGRRMFDGRVEAIHKDPLDHDTVHVLMMSNNGKMREVALAPAWYLAFIDCTIAKGVMVQNGSGFSFDRQTKNPSIIFAQKMSVNNNTCRLRNSSGFAYWSNHFR